MDARRALGLSGLWLGGLLVIGVSCDAPQGPTAAVPTPVEATEPALAVPAGGARLIQDQPDRPGLPPHFRTMIDPFPADAEGPLPSRAGLDRLRASGSAQFSSAQLQAIAERVGPALIVVDLRQESHGFLDGVAVSWDTLPDEVSAVPSLPQVQQDERRRLDALAAAGSVTALVPPSRNPPGTARQDEPVTLSAQIALTEGELARSLGLGYFRVPVTDFQLPTAENVDLFVAFASSLPPEIWLHFHCHGGEGRTTIFLAVWDMMHNAGTVSVDDILRRQELLGPRDLFTVGTPEQETYPFQVELAAFMRQFYEYARENAATGFIVPWSVWSATRPLSH